MQDEPDYRLEALHRYDILDTPAEEAFDDLVEAASMLCNAPIALVSLVDEERQWFKACLGLNVRETPVDQAVCAIAIRQDDPLVIPDLALDPRTAANPLVTRDPRIRFYAGVPLVDREGHALGTLCVIDTVPRPEGLTRSQLRGLGALARQVTHAIEMRSAVEEREASIDRHRRRSDAVQARMAQIEEARASAEKRDGRATAAQEAGRIGTFELDVASDIAFVSPQFCRLFGLPEASTYGFGEIERNILPDAESAHSARGSRIDGSAPLDVEYRIRRPSDGHIRWIARRAQFEREGGQVVRMLGTVHDVTERRLEGQRVLALLELGDQLRDVESIADTVAIASHILGRELAADRVGYAIVDRTSGTFRIERDWTAPGVPSLIGTHPLSGVAETLERLSSGRSMTLADVAQTAWLREDREAYGQFGAQALINVPLLVRQHLVGVLFVHAGTLRTWTATDIDLAHGVADRTYATIAQLEAEEQRNVLNMELSHRMKNMLAMVQAIAAQTLRGVGEREAVKAFNQRLMALSTAHDVLFQEHWAAAPVAGVAERVLAALGVLDRVRLAGPAIAFGPRAALALSLLLHELATNALKYGALSAEQGSVNLDWRIEGVGADAMFHMAWRESGGPAVAEPSRTGFGSRLIKMGLLGTGGALTHYFLSGLEADFAVSLSRAIGE